jgi:hypothetical protein
MQWNLALLSMCSSPEIIYLVWETFWNVRIISSECL